MEIGGEGGGLNFPQAIHTHSLSLYIYIYISLSLSSFLVLFLAFFCFLGFVSLFLCLVSLFLFRENTQHQNIKLDCFFINPFCFLGFLSCFVFLISFSYLCFLLIFSCVCGQHQCFLSFKNDKLKTPIFAEVGGCNKTCFKICVLQNVKSWFCQFRGKFWWMFKNTVN